MKNLKFLCLMISILFLVSCSASGNKGFVNFSAPVDLLLTPSSYLIKGKQRQFVLIANLQIGTVTVVDVNDEKVHDLDDFDKQETSIAVGGEPISLAIQQIDSDQIADRLFVADREGEQIVIVNLLKNSADNDKFLRYSYADGGSPEISGATTPVFKDKGQFSSPRIEEVTVSNLNNEIENWFFEYKSSNYRVKSSISGWQTGRASEDQTYTSDNGTVSLLINQGPDKTTRDDNVTFTSFKLKPLALGYTPRAIFIYKQQLIVVDYDNVQLKFYSLDDYSLSKTVAIDDGSGQAMFIDSAFLLGDSIYLLNNRIANLVRLQLTDDSQTTIDLSAKASYAFGNSDNSMIYLLLPLERLMVALNPSTNQLASKTIEFPSTPDAATAGNFSYKDFSGSAAAVSTKEDGVYLVDLENMSRLDLSGNGVDESSASKPKLENFENNSGPSMTSVTTYDGITRSQVWTVIYEGLIPLNFGSSGSLAGAVFTDAGQEFTEQKLTAGDMLLVIDAAGGREYIISEIVDQTTLRLTADSGLNQSGLTYEIRAKNSYVVEGSLSGVQSNRAVAGTSYSSDDGEISFSIVANINNPVVRDDFFTFRSFDGVNSINVNGSNGSRALNVAHSADRDYLWLSFAGSSSLSIVDFANRRERKTID